MLKPFELYDFRATSDLLTVEDELDLGVKINTRLYRWLRKIYEQRFDDEWLERREMPVLFFSEWENYEWLFKRAIAGYQISIDDRKFMNRYENSLEYQCMPELKERYEQLKEIFSDTLRPVYGDQGGWYYQ